MIFLGIFLGPVAVTGVQVVGPAIVQIFIRHLRYVGVLPAEPTDKQTEEEKKEITEQVKYWNICIAVSSFFSSLISLFFVSFVYALLVPGTGARVAAVIVAAGCPIVAFALVGIRENTAKKLINKDDFGEESGASGLQLLWKSRWTKLRFAVVAVSWLLGLLVLSLG